MKISSNVISGTRRGHEHYYNKCKKRLLLMDVPTNAGRVGVQGVHEGDYISHRAHADNDKNDNSQMLENVQNKRQSSHLTVPPQSLKFLDPAKKKKAEEGQSSQKSTGYSPAASVASNEVVMTACPTNASVTVISISGST